MEYPCFRSNMKFLEKVIFPSFIAFVLLAKISKQMKPEDCIPLKQYWSTHFINENGTCAACPPLFETCSQQGPDRKSCEDSCFAEPPITPLKPATTPPKPTFPYIPPVFSSVPPYPSTSGEAKKYEKSTRFDANMHQLLIVLGVLLIILVILGVVAVVMLLCIRKLVKRNETYRDGENKIALEPLHQNNGGEQSDGEGRAQLPNGGEGRALVPNDGEGCAQLLNDGERRAQLPNDSERRAQVSNGGEGRAQVSNDGEGRAQVPNDGEGRAQVPDDGKRRAQLPNDGDGRTQVLGGGERFVHVPNNGDECAQVPNNFKGYAQVANGGEGQAHVLNDGEGLAHVPNNDVERNVGVPNEFEAPFQESQLPSTTQPTPASGMPEDLGSSLDVHTEVHN